ncbi:MAG: hypothetical protein ACP5E4_03550 [Candidatus Aenigmatarchaeota archaeon]
METKTNKRLKKFVFSYRGEFEFIVYARNKEEALSKVYKGEITKINLFTEPHREFLEVVED